MLAYLRSLCWHVPGRYGDYGKITVTETHTATDGTIISTAAIAHYRVEVRRCKLCGATTRIKRTRI
jgi:hypothetical protein